MAKAKKNSANESMKIIAAFIQGQLDDGMSLDTAAETAKERYRLSSPDAAKKAYEVINADDEVEF